MYVIIIYVCVPIEQTCLFVQSLRVDALLPTGAIASFGVG